MDEQAVAQDVATNTGEETITLSTPRFGEVTVEKSRILDFPRGLVGLPDACQFVFLHLEEAAAPFFWLQCVDDPGLAFVVCEPQSFFPDYQVPLTREEQEFLAIQETEEGLVCLILVVPEDPRKITANLRGPLVVNVEARRGMQLLLTGDEYPTKAPLFRDPTVEGGAACSS